MKHLIRLSTALALCAPQVSQAAEQSVDTLIKQLQSGGLVLYLRHAKTEKDYADQITADPQNCGTQRSLSEAGWHQARTIGTAISHLNIPVGTVVSSQYCRAWQTADLAFGTYSKTPDLNFAKAETYTDAQTKNMRDHLLPLLTVTPPKGKNAVIVGHDDPFEAATGIYPEPQGVAYVLKSGSDGTFEILGHIDPDEWPQH